MFFKLSTISLLYIVELFLLNIEDNLFLGVFDEDIESKFFLEKILLLF
jgi:hypothetical protein